ncbi:MAG: ACP S-malonyltransferase [Deltaproteobacteria bacterium]|nr:ACP S-malonyltransferase [Deltaproteobacteria bacterium]
MADRTGVVAWLAPGQGMERPGMGRDVAEHWPEAAHLLVLVAAGVSGPRLDGTDAVQPALTAVALGAAAALRARGLQPDVVAGHSVGELAAWAVAGGVRPIEAVRLARVRGEAMREAALGSPGGLWALAPEDVPDPLPAGTCVAVENPGQIVLAGFFPPGPCAIPVATTGPWHSPAMAAAVPALEAALTALPVRRLGVPLVSNHTGKLVTDDATVRAHLVAQLTHPARWTAVLATLADLGVTDVVLLGPGRVLAHHVRAALPKARIHRTDRSSAILAVDLGD